jgi:poly-beta-1,6-N-acetyl-D-glucosamine synthase
MSERLDGPLRLAVIVTFLNEERHLPELLASIAAQRRPPDELLLVDDGSSDGSPAIAEAFEAEHSYVRALKRPPRAPESDRLATAAELKGFQWGVERLAQTPAIVAKLDADLRLSPSLFLAVERAFAADPRLGVTGSYLAVEDSSGRLRREYNPPDHIRGPNKFYRWRCYEDIQPIEAHLGWDTVDEVKARMRGWATRNLALPDGDPVHLRPTGLHDGRLRAQRRWGVCAWGFGQPAAIVVVGGVLRFADEPYVLGGLNYILGWMLAAIRRAPRADPDVRAFVRREKTRAAFYQLRHPARSLIGRHATSRN